MSSTGTGRYRDLLGRNRDFRVLTGAFLVDSIGGWACSIVMVVWVFDQTHSPTWVAATTAAGWLPRAVFSTYAGVLADRYERTQVMLASALLAFLASAALTLVVAADGPVVLALACQAAGSIVYSGYRPAAQAVLPDVVSERDLVSANALFGALENLVVVIGPGLGGLLLVVGSPAEGVAVNALSFLGAALLVVRLRVRSRGDAGQAGESTARQMAEGFKVLWQRRIALVLVVFCCLDSGVYAASTIVNVPLSHQLGTGNNGYSYLVAAFALGGVIAAGLANKLSASVRLAPVILLGMFALAMPFAAVSLVHNPYVAFAILSVSGAGMILVDVLAITALQREVPGEVQSRVFGIFESAVVGSILVASFITAAVLSATSLKTTLVAIGVGFSGAAVLGIGPVLKADRGSMARVRALAPRIALLESLGLFAGASRAALERLASGATESTVTDGHTVIREGDAADALYVLTEGSVAVSAMGEGKQSRRLRVMQAPTYFGEIGLLRGLPRTATVRALSECTLLRIEGDEFFAAVQSAGVSSSVLSRSAAQLARSHPRLSETTEAIVIPTQRSEEVDLTSQAREDEHVAG
jgi:CRP-like cAMP-binding protein/predicted MFS family arabinose efflux permease